MAKPKCRFTIWNRCSALDRTDAFLDSCARSGPAIAFNVPLRAGTRHRTVERRPTRGEIGSLIRPLVAGATEDDLIVIAYQIGGLIQVVHIRRGGGHRVDIPGAGIHPEITITVN